jgi:beta-lactam-binding protein with PASTA domain
VPGPGDDTRTYRRRRPLRTLGPGAALAVAFTAGGLGVWMKWSSAAHAVPVPVPPIVGLTRADAETTIRSARLIPVAVPASTAAATCAAGSVTGQAPAPPSTAVQGSTVTYQLCAPANPGTPAASPTPKPDVTSTAPAAPSKTSAARPASHSPSPKPLPPKVPCVVNYTGDTASAVLGEAGYKVKTATSTADGTPGTVTSQSPGCGVRVARGDTVRILVRAEPSPSPSAAGNGG